MKTISLSIAAILLAFTMNAQTTSWNFDKSHSKVAFSVTHMMISEVMGSFGKFSGTLLSDKPDFSDAKITFKIDPTSINTDEPSRDKHLNSPDFFNTAKFPEILFEGKEFKSLGNNKFQLTGDLTMVGVTKSVTLEVKSSGTIKDPYGKTRAGFKITGTIDRTKWGLMYNSAMDSGGLMIGNEVSILCYIEVVKP